MSIVKYTAGSLMWVYFSAGGPGLLVQIPTKSKLDHLC